MKKSISYLFLLLAVSLTSCLSSIKKENKIDITTVDSIVMYRDSLDNNIILSKKLSQNTTKQFIEDWNASASNGPCIYLAKYIITVYKKGKTKQDFRANGKNIKEKTDQCFDMGAENYFDKLWQSADNITNVIVNKIENSTAPTFPLQTKVRLVGDSVLLPEFEIEVKLSNKAEKKLAACKETIIVVAYFSGMPKDTTNEDYLMWGKIRFASKQIELTNKRIARFENIKIKKSVFNLLADANYEVLINVVSGRKTTTDNLLDCDILQQNILYVTGKKYILKGKLIYGE